MLLQGARAHALIRGSDHVLPSDVQAIMGDVLGHRILLDWRAAERGLTVPGFLAGLAASISVA
jgi:MoxR-like ATPase